MDSINIIQISTIVAWALIGIGLVSIFLPFAPGIPTIWFGIFIYAISHGFDDISRNYMGIISGVAIFTIFLDYTLSSFGVQKLRASAWAVGGAIVGFIVGSFFNPFIAFIIAPALGAIIAELLRGRDQVYSFTSGNTTIVAFMGGTVVKMAAALVMIGMFVLRLQGKL
jgi:uncharacterized protein YqgC (DUF456 family)